MANIPLPQPNTSDIYSYDFNKRLYKNISEEELTKEEDTVSNAVVYDSTTGVNPTTITEGTLPEGVNISTYVNFAVIASNVSTTIGNGVSAVAIPSGLNEKNLIKALAVVHTKGVTGVLDIQARRRRLGVDADMLLTKLSIGDVYFAENSLIDTLNDDVLTGDQIYIDIDDIHSGTAAKGLSVVLTFN